MLNIINIDQNNFSISGTTGSGLKVYSKLGVVAKKCETVYNELFSRVTIADKTSQIVSKTPVSHVSLDNVVYATAEEFVTAFNEMINNIEATTTGEVTTTAENTTTIEATTTVEPTTTLEYVDFGYNTVYGITTSVTNRRAMPVVFTEDGTILSVSFYHNGGVGNALVGVYSDDANTPDARIAISAETAINVSEGWNTINLISPVFVNSGVRVWLAVVPSIGGMRYEAGTPYRANATSSNYSHGLPEDFYSGSEVTITSYRQSIYCTYFK